MTPGDIYLAPPPIEGSDAPLWRVKILAKPRHGTVLVRWLEGDLRGKEARLVVKTLAKEKT